MAKERYYSICEMGDCDVTSTTKIVPDTTAGHFDASYARCGIKITSTTDYFDTPPFVDAASPTTIYFAANLYRQDDGSSLTLMEFVNSSGQSVIRLKTYGNFSSSFLVQYWNGSAWTDLSSATFIINRDALVRLSGKIVCGASGSVVINVASAEVYNQPSTNVNVNNIAKVRHRSASNSLGTTWSQCAGANFELRDLIIRHDHMTGNSATNTAWSGDYTAIDENNQDDTDAISSASVGQREGYTHGAFTLPSGMAIDSVWVSGRGRVSGGGPTDAKYSLLVGGTDYDSSLLTLGTSYAARQRYWATNPAGGSWSQATYNSAEFGLVSA